MSLSRVREGDVVQVAGAIAHVTGKQPRRLQVRWVGSGSVRWVRAAEVEAHWARRA